MLLVEAAGFDRVLVETVGVGQSEYAVDEMVDCFLLLAAPGGGDELQGIKRGVMDLADLVVVTKADGPLEGQARHAVADYRAALGLMRPKHAGWTPETLMTSALQRCGIEAVADAVRRHRDALAGDGSLAARRGEQARHWLWREVEAERIARLGDTGGIDDERHRIKAEVAADELAPTVGARALVRAFFSQK